MHMFAHMSYASLHRSRTRRYRVSGVIDRGRWISPALSHAALRLLELAQTQFAGQCVMGFVELHLIGTVRQACKALHAVRLESYLDRVLEHSLPSDAAALQRVLCERVCGQAAWPPIARRLALAAILRVPGLELGWGLREAALNGHAEVVDALLEANAAVDNRSDHVSTPLHWAARKGHAACVAALVEANAAVDSQDNEGATPLHFAADSSHATCVAALLEANAPIDGQDNEGATPLHWAADSGQTACVAALLEANAAVDGQGCGDGTPLHGAARKGHTTCVVALLGANAAVDSQGYNGRTPLYSAAYKGHIAVALMLRRAGAKD